MEGADGYGFADAKLIELRSGSSQAIVVGLVRDEHDRLFGAAQGIRHIHVGGGNARGGVNGEYDYISVSNRKLNLPLYLLPDVSFGEEVEAAGVDEDESVLCPDRFQHYAVARGARDVGDDCGGAAN